MVLADSQYTITKIQYVLLILLQNPSFNLEGSRFINLFRFERWAQGCHTPVPQVNPFFARPYYRHFLVTQLNRDLSGLPISLGNSWSARHYQRNTLGYELIHTLETHVVLEQTVLKLPDLQKSESEKVRFGKVLSLEVKMCILRVSVI